MPLPPNSATPPALPRGPVRSRRDAVRLLGLAGIGAAAAGCGSSGSGSGGSVSGTLKYHTWSNSQLPSMRAVTKGFTRKYPHASVNVDVTPDPPYFQKLEAAGTTRTLPDVFWMHGREFLLYASAGLLKPIDDVVKEQRIDLAHYPKQLLDLYVYQGHRYAIPRNNNLIGLWYNKKLLDEAKVPHPDSTWTWSDLADAAAELTSRSRGQYGFAATLNDQTGYWNAIYQNNGTVISADMSASGYDRPETVEALEWWTGFIRKKTSPSYQQMVETDPFTLFQSGKVAMTFDGDWQTAALLTDRAFAEHVDVAVLPKGRRHASILHGTGNVVAANSKHAAAGQALVGYLAGPAAQKVQSEKGASGPPADQTAVKAWVGSMPQFSLAKLNAQVADGVLYPHSRNTESWLDLQTKHLADAWSGKKPVESAARDLAKAMNDQLKKEQG